MLLLVAVLLNVGLGPSEPHAPVDLSETGLYADFQRRVISPKHLAFAPQYPLWTDGATKRRWISLPPGTAIDGTDPDLWEFPAGTRFWKEFSFDGRPVETRFLELLADGSWRYAAYAWSLDGSRAELVSPRGLRDAYPLADGRSHDIPSVSDCRVCHEAGRNRVLGFGALQLSPDRDPGALHPDAAEGQVDLAHLVAYGLLVNFPDALVAPRIAAASPNERAALGYMHGNCGHCHDAGSKLGNVGLFLRFYAEAAMQPALATTIGHPVRRMAPGQSSDSTLRIAPGHPEQSALAVRVGSRHPALQMPPLGTELVDQEAVDLLRRWIAELDDASQDQQHDQHKE